MFCTSFFGRHEYEIKSVRVRHVARWDAYGNLLVHESVVTTSTCKKCGKTVHEAYAPGLKTRVYSKRFMKKLMIECPHTREYIFTGIVLDEASFASATLRRNTAYCSHCNDRHFWNKEDVTLVDADQQKN